MGVKCVLLLVVSVFLYCELMCFVVDKFEEVLVLLNIYIFVINIVNNVDVIIEIDE